MEVRRIVDSMSHWDLIDLYKQEIPFSEYKINEQLKKCVRMLYDSHKELTVFRPIEYKRKSGFNIVVQTFDRGTSFPKKERPPASFFTFGSTIEVASVLSNLLSIRITD